MHHTVGNTLYITLENAHLRLSNENLVIEHPDTPLRDVPLHHLQAVVLLGNIQVSTPLIVFCAERGISIVWCSQYGRFKARLEGAQKGNVLLRRAQHLALSDAQQTLQLAKQFVIGKLHNQMQLFLRGVRRYSDAVLMQAVATMQVYLGKAQHATSLDELRGVEGSAARVYFEHFDRLIRAQREAFRLHGRTRRPPQDRTNALLSFLYTLYVQECISALEAVGLDPQVGYLHALRPGRPALALDLVEALRPAFVDRLALRLINQSIIRPEHFEPPQPNAVYLNEEGRRVVLKAYELRQRETVQHPDAAEPVPWRLVPHLQARRLAQALRGDAPCYEPFLIR